jgi:glycosyl transferase family 2
VKIVQTLVVRDEVDVVGEQIEYHLNAGVDYVIASDHGSLDGTTEVLESYARDGHLRLLRQSGQMRDSEWRTTMARLAATEFEADWVLNTDADEFWMPRYGTLKDVFAAVPERVGVVWALTRHFVPRPDDGQSFAERMMIRYSGAAPLNDPTSAYRPHAKAAHRADPRVVVFYGSHDVRSAAGRLPGWYRADVLHFPFRTQTQWERKGVRRARVDKSLGQYVRASEAAETGRTEDVYASLVVDDEAVERGTRAGSLVVDTRLRDALRSLHGHEQSETTTVRHEPIDAGAQTAVDATVLFEADLVRMHRRLDLLKRRLDALEEPSLRTPPVRPGHPGS